jgi:hypothetical protein
MASAALEDKQRTYELIQLVNPLNHGSTAAGIKKYKTEPYVIAADVYAVENHEGMGGWTWYTGSAGWLYRGIERRRIRRSAAGGRAHCPSPLLVAQRRKALPAALGQ